MREDRCSDRCSAYRAHRPASWSSFCQKDRRASAPSSYLGIPDRRAAGSGRCLPVCRHDSPRRTRRKLTYLGLLEPAHRPRLSRKTRLAPTTEPPQTVSLRSLIDHAPDAALLAICDVERTVGALRHTIGSIDGGIRFH